LIAVDTNILVYAHREDSDWHEQAYSKIVQLAEGLAPWAIPWPCIHEFLAIVTHPKIYSPPTPLTEAVDQINAWFEAPSLRLLTEFEGYWKNLRTIVEAGRIAGAQIHDARIAALCMLHGVRILWTADRDFSRFPELNTQNPLVDRR
jgi:toxin-antitoxin system PIN domain toxin